jgi:hypothetical protein
MTAAALLALPPALPDEAAGWKAVAPADRYDADTIFQYIDGLGEVYLAYGMTSCHARRYAPPDGEERVIVDLFEMASAADAFGVFTHSREGEPVAVGQGATFGYGTLFFWKGQDFVSVSADRDNERTREAVMALGRAVEAAIVEAGALPTIIDRLPKAGLDEASVVYLRHPRILEAHVPVGPGNPFGLGPQAPAVVGRYRTRGGAADLLVVEYPDAPAAEAAAAIFSQRFLDGTQPARRDDGWCAAAALSERARAYVLRAPSLEEALALLAEATKGGPP